MFESNNLPLLLLQSSCFSVMLVLALLLLMSRWHMKATSRNYETSRWLLIAALVLYVIHYLLQMIFGFRANSEDVGTLVNMVFYLPVAFLMASATLRISAGQRYLSRFVKVGATGTVITWAIFLVGLFSYGSLHMPWVLRIIEVIYVAMIAFFIFNPGGELRRMNRKIEDETADDQTPYRLYMRSSTTLLYVMGLIGALSVFSTVAVFSVALFFLLALIFYVVSFLALGFHVQSVSDIVDDENQASASGDAAHATADVTSAETVTPGLSAEMTEQITEAITQWRQAKGYGAQNLTIITMAERLGISKRQLTQYLTECEGSTFRVWLSNIRIEEAKAMLLMENDYGIEFIAETCGFSSRSWLTEKFKTATGMTPKEWREAQKAQNTRQSIAKST